MESALNRFVMLFCAVAVVFSSVVLPQRGLSQDAPFAPATESASAATSLPSAPQAPTPRSHVETSISLGATGQLTASRITETSSALPLADTRNALVTQSLSPSAGLLATFRQSFGTWLGYSVNLGYTRATYRYIQAAPASSTGQTFETFIPNNIYETSVSYIAQKRLTSSLTVFGEAGAGAIAFAASYYDVHSSPRNFSLTYRNNTFRPEGIAGFGMDYRLGHGLGLRAEYRGLFLKYPDYASGSIRPTTISNAPTLSVTYALGKHSKH
jgi:hypothetical protein